MIPHRVYAHFASILNDRCVAEDSHPDFFSKDRWDGENVASRRNYCSILQICGGCAGHMCSSCEQLTNKISDTLCDMGAHCECGGHDCVSCEYNRFELAKDELDDNFVNFIVENFNPSNE